MRYLIFIIFNRLFRYSLPKGSDSSDFDRRRSGYRTCNEDEDDDVCCLFTSLTYSLENEIILTHCKI
jgi:hypothetical protein